MRITVNGESLEVADSITVDQLMRQLHYEPVRVAVAVNLEFVPRSAYGDTRLAESDQVEIVAAVAGG